MKYCCLFENQQNIFGCNVKEKKCCVIEKLFGIRYLDLISPPIIARYWSIYRRLCQRFRKKEIPDDNNRV